MLLLLVLSWDLEDWPVGNDHISVRYFANTGQSTLPAAIYYLLLLLTTEFSLSEHCIMLKIQFCQNPFLASLLLTEVFSLGI